MASLSRRFRTLPAGRAPVVSTGARSIRATANFSLPDAYGATGTSPTRTSSVTFETFRSAPTETDEPLLVTV
jgi:hypothetical protein